MHKRTRSVAFIDRSQGSNFRLSQLDDVIQFKRIYVAITTLPQLEFALQTRTTTLLAATIAIATTSATANARRHRGVLAAFVIASGFPSLDAEILRECCRDIVKAPRPPSQRPLKYVSNLGLEPRHDRRCSSAASRQSTAPLGRADQHQSGLAAAHAANHLCASLRFAAAAAAPGTTSTAVTASVTSTATTTPVAATISASTPTVATACC